MVLTAFAVATSRIGLAATASTTYGEPFHLARAFASLDHISGGRAAWNAVTTSYASTGANFGVQHPAHADRYAIAEEFIDVVCGLWDSWEDDAFPRDKSTGIFADQSKRHVARSQGHRSFRSKARSTPRARRRGIRSSCSPARPSPASS